MILGDCSFCPPKIPCLHPLNNISHSLNYICHMMVCGTSAWLDQETEVWVLSKIIWRFKILRWNHCMKNGCSYRDVHYGFLKSCFQALRWALLLFLSVLQKYRSDTEDNSDSKTASSLANDFRLTSSYPISMWVCVRDNPPLLKHSITKIYKIGLFKKLKRNSFPIDIYTTRSLVVTTTNHIWWPLDRRQV